MSADAWPELPYAAWSDTCRTLHLITQIVGKVRLARTPWLNHSWQTPLYLSARGLATGPIPHGERTFDLELDLIDHRLAVRVDDGRSSAVELQARPMAETYAAIMSALAEAGVPVRIHTLPNELADAVPFPEDHAPRAYDRVWAMRFWRVLLRLDRSFKLFRTGFLGKASPVHFFWGSFDLAVTRFSGRPAPPHPGGIPNLPDAVAREAYSHEVSSCGFWPGGPGFEAPMVYAYAYPEPPGFREAQVQPAAARFEAGLGEFVLPYDALCAAADPDAALMAFLQSSYAAAADLAHWDRAALECDLGRPEPQPTTRSSTRISGGPAAKSPPPWRAWKLARWVWIAASSV